MFQMHNVLKLGQIYLEKQFVSISTTLILHYNITQCMAEPQNFSTMNDLCYMVAMYFNLYHASYRVLKSQLTRSSNGSFNH